MCIRDSDYLALRDDNSVDAWNSLGGSKRVRDKLKRQLETLVVEVQRSEDGQPFEIRPGPDEKPSLIRTKRYVFPIRITWIYQETTVMNREIGPWTFSTVNKGAGGWRIHKIENASWCASAGPDRRQTLKAWLLLKLTQERSLSRSPFLAGRAAQRLRSIALVTHPVAPMLVDQRSDRTQGRRHTIARSGLKRVEPHQYI